MKTNLIKIHLPAVLGVLLGALASFEAGAHSGHGRDDRPVTGAAQAESTYFKGLRGDYTAQPARWWKGNTHAHSWWMGGDSPPENAAAWYREHGYQFLVLSEHNRLQENTVWYPIEDAASAEALAIYREHFGDDWVETRVTEAGITEVKLKPLDEYRHLFEAPGEFTFIQGEEITDSFESNPSHMGAVNIHEVIVPRGGDTAAEVLQNNLNAVLDQGEKSGRDVLAHINHPNFRYGITVEDILSLRYATGEGFFELYNGHHAVQNYGDEYHMGLEKMWDVILAKSLAEGDGALMYGIATDDAHAFTRWRVGGDSNPGRGWVMVRATRLTPDYIVSAMKRGDFYASTGVTLDKLVAGDNVLALSIDGEPGVEYTVEFIGTRRGADLRGREIADLPSDMQGRASLRYSDDIGVVLKTQRGTEARYEARGDELYVRARVTSTKPHPHPFKAGDTEMAWTQPITITPRQ